jgi:hypothetical protein
MEFCGAAKRSPGGEANPESELMDGFKRRDQGKQFSIRRRVVPKGKATPGFAQFPGRL